MTHKILFWINEGIIEFGVAKSIQEKSTHELFAIIDVNPELRVFFENQTFVKFNQSWYFRDFLSFSNRPDLEFLSNFEKKYKINLWQIAFSERFFLSYNKFHKFNKNEILQILESECKFFEKILLEIKPDFLCIQTTDIHRTHLLHQLCVSMGIVPLMLAPTRFGGRMMISEDFDTFPHFSNKHSESTITFSKHEFDKYLKNNNQASHLLKSKKAKHSKFYSFSKYLKALQIVSNDKYNNFYENRGVTPFKYMRKGNFSLGHKLSKRRREKFLQENSSFDVSGNFIYFPLHLEPERTLLMSAPFYTDQLNVISNIAKSLPVDHELFVKEHYNMEQLGWRDESFYKKILDMPNVRLIHYSIPAEKLFSKCSMVITISGTSAFESALYKKPSIVFSNVSFDYLPFIKRLTSFEQLPNSIRGLLNSSFDFGKAKSYVELVDFNSFKFNNIEFTRSLKEILFSKNYGFRETKVSNQIFEDFFKLHEDSFSILANEHLKKINT